MEAQKISNEALKPKITDSYTLEKKENAEKLALAYA